MKKAIWAALLLVIVGMPACDESASDCEELPNCENLPINPDKTEDPKAYGSLCVNSGGVFENSSCVCNGVTCDAGDVCNTSTKACPVHIEPDQFKKACTESGGTPNGSVCTCGGETCAAWQVCVDNQCPKTSTPDFSQMCSYSGGKATGNVCTCSGSDCEAGVVCNTETGTCPKPQAEDCQVCEKCKDCDVTCNFDSACKSSGGKVEDGVCVCGNNRCDNGVICNFDTKECVGHDVKAGDKCSSTDASICRDEGNVGQLLACNGSEYKTSTCKNDAGEDVSCHGNTCGACKNYELTCVDQLNEKNEAIGAVMSCQDGVAEKVIVDCKDVSCRKDKPVCGECINGALKCTDDKNLNVITLDDGKQITDDKLYAVMWRCTDGQWKRIQNQYDSIDPSYACPTYCQTTSAISVQQRVTKCYENAQREEMCQACDPCAGSAYDSSRSTQLSNFNPCYDEARCAEIKKTEDPDYPPFRRDLNDERIYKKIYGYNYSYSPYTDMDLNYNPPADKMGEFYFDLTNNTRHLSCNPDKTYYGRCHNSLQNCINKSFQADGYIIQCVNGALMDYDNNNDELACYCANGTMCYTTRNCHKNTIITSNIRVCARPESPVSGYGENPIPMD